MTFIQQYYREEYRHGRRYWRFVISDVYDDLFKKDVDFDGINDGIQTKVYILGKVKKDLEVKEGGFAVDELTINIESASLLTDVDKKAAAFIQDSTDIDAKRFVALFYFESISDEPSTSNIIFIGRMNDKVSVDDISWVADNYNQNIVPTSNWSFTAYSLDATLLEKAKLIGEIRKPDNTIIPGIYGFDDEGTSSRISQGEIDALTNMEDYPYKYFDHTKQFSAPKMINLFSALELLLNKAEEIIEELEDVSITFELLPVNLGFSVIPLDYSVSLWASHQYFGVVPVNTKFVNEDFALELELGDEYTAERSGIIVNALHFDWNSDEAERQHLLRSSDNIAELLFGVARSLGCYIQFRYVTTTHIQIQLIPIPKITANNQLFIKVPSESTIDSSSVTVEGGNKVLSVISNVLGVGLEYVQKIRWDEPTPKRLMYEEKLEKETKYKGAKFEKILFAIGGVIDSRSWGSENYNKENAPSYPYPLNSAGTKSRVQSYMMNWGKEKYINVVDNSIYVRVTDILAGIVDIRPCSTIVTRYKSRSGDIIKEYGSGVKGLDSPLADYINDIASNKEQYYETERQLKIPYWTAFSEFNDGTDSSLYNLKLGNYIALQTTFQHWDGDEWVEQIVVKNYTIVGIEYNTSEPEVQLKLISQDAFPFNYFELLPGESIPSVGIEMPDEGIEIIEEGTATADLIVEYGSIQIGEAVSITVNKGVVKTQALYNPEVLQCIGIAITAGEEGDSIVVVTGGTIKLESWEFGEGAIYARSNEYNLTQHLLEEKTEDEDMVIIVGYPLSSKSMKIAIREYRYLL